jgi:DNA-binding CsgD family transcriptional regulator
VLVGRQAERARIDSLIDRARRGRSGTLVVLGEPGIGKTSLLRYAAGAADRMTVVRTQGVPSEAALAFAGLHDICRPLLANIGDREGMQVDALRGALGLEAREVPDALAIGAATLSLIAAAAEQQPVLVLVDDVQWVDQESVAALLFAARRLDADAVAILAAAREEPDAVLGRGWLEELKLGGLTRNDAAALLEGVDVSPDVAERLYVATAGNPLGLVELPKVLTPTQLSGEEPLFEPLPVGARVERAFSARLAELSSDDRRALVIVAASSSGDTSVLLAAIAAAGLDASVLERAEDAGLLRLSRGRVHFWHPLVRSVVHEAASPSERRRAHKLLAAAFASAGDRERAAWHRASAMFGPDEDAARALERVGRVSRKRGAYSAAAHAFERAAELTPDLELRAERLANAADARWATGDAESALELLDEALARVESPEIRADLLALRGNIEHRSGNSSDAIRLLVGAADLLGEADADRSVPMLADAFEAALQSGEAQQCLDIAARIAALSGSDPDDGFYAALTGGVAALNAGQQQEGERLLRRAVTLVEDGSGPSSARHGHWTALAAAWLNEHEHARSLNAEAIAGLRREGRISELPEALRFHAIQELHLGNSDAARAAFTESLTLAEQSGQAVNTAFAHGFLALLEAICGNDAACRDSAREAIVRSETLGRFQLRLLAERSLALLCLGSGRLEEAVERLAQWRTAADAHGLAWQHLELSADLVEALVRSGRLADARAATARVPVPRLPNERALVERARAQLERDDFEEHFAIALESHAEGCDAFEEARTRLLFGERLRRAGRKRDARTQLRHALRKFELLRAEPWSTRTRAELSASGDRNEPPERVTTDELTAQELQVALQVAKGLTNREVAGALFLSPKTIEFHLTRVYRKLDVRSRAELVRLFLAHDSETRR